MNDTKLILQSKTFWTNVLIALSPLVPQVQSFLAHNPEAFVAMFAVINVILRLVTKQGVTIK